MPEPTLIVTLPDGSTATRRTHRAYVSAVVYRVTQAEADAAAAELARALEAATPELRADFAAKVARYQAANAPIRAYLDAADAAHKSGTANPIPRPDRATWEARDRVVHAVTSHPIFRLEAVDGLGGGGLHAWPARVQATVGEVGVVQWNQRPDLSAKALATARAEHPLRELAIVPVSKVER